MLRVPVKDNDVLAAELHVLTSPVEHFDVLTSELHVGWSSVERFDVLTTKGDAFGTYNEVLDTGCDDALTGDADALGYDGAACSSDT